MASTSTINLSSLNDHERASDTFGGATAPFVKKIRRKQDKQLLKRSSTELSGIEGVGQVKEKYVGQISKGSDLSLMG